MPDTNVNSYTSFLGKSNTNRHGYAPARAETEKEELMRAELESIDRKRELAEYDAARNNGGITYTEKRITN